MHQILFQIDVNFHILIFPSYCFKIMKSLYLIKDLYSVHLYTSELSFFFLLTEKFNLYFLLICSFPRLVSLISTFIISYIYNKIF